jgi:hypothetical protein
MRDGKLGMPVVPMTTATVPIEAWSNSSCLRLLHRGEIASHKIDYSSILAV